MFDTLPAVTKPRKHFLTRGYVPFGNVRPMDDDRSWARAREPWERLAWARARLFTTKKEGGAAVGMKEHTYSAYERAPDSSKHTPLDYENAVHFANRFKVRWQWLLEGKGLPWLSEPEAAPLTPAQQRAAELLDGRSPEDQERIVDAWATLIRTGTGG